MTYGQTLDWLFAQLPMYQRTGGANYKIDLEKTHLLMDLLGHPERGFKSIHVAGTNGKGSTSHMLASVLQEAGFTVGLYTSPHLKDFRERIKINGQMISEAEVIDFVARYKSDFLRLELSFFEMTVGLAFTWFAQQNVDIAVVEVGMGGRLDSTNVVTPLLSVITNIGFDHMAFLGNTLSDIAGEKAGIIKPNVPVVIGRTQPETEVVFRAKAQENSAPIVFADQLPHCGLTSDLTGIYQHENIQTVHTALAQLPENYQPKNDALNRGLQNVVANTGLRGRWEILGKNPLMVCDNGHNEDGIRMVLQHIAKTPYQNLHMVWGMVSDKDVTKTLSMLPKNATYYFTQPSIPRGLPVAELVAAAHQIGLKGAAFATVPEAVLAARKNAQANDFIFIGGSTFVVADAL
jgi:dihydrofolate synthase/folylpolyglutamate synthase